jgi:hypothetical protein
VSRSSCALRGVAIAEFVFGISAFFASRVPPEPTCQE